VNTPGKVSLLIVDDDPPIRRLLERVAVRAGFDVDTAKDGLEALEKIEKKEYAIAIIDLMMPRLSGYDLVQKISALDPRPVIIVATALTNGDVAKIDDTLVRRVIKKPFDVKSVADALVDTARHIAEKKAGMEATVPIASPDAAVIKVIEDETQADAAAEKEKEKASPPKDELPKRPS
jgi:DNA-binding response OmpR family regulator